MWPTPAANKTTESGELVNADGTPWDGISKPHSKNTGKQVQTALTDAVRMWPTPDASNRGPRSADLVVNQSTVQRRDSGQKRGIDLQTAAGGSLNPQFVEWLMGYPVGYTDLNN
jgi:DNA (cytosine-5)-methyltransferase 1